jgi:hypothetical protein
MRTVLAGLLLFAACTAPAEAPPDAAPLDGDALVEARCGRGCHGVDWVTRYHGDEAGWRDTIDRMIGYGAVLGDGERDALASYLAERYPP